MKRYLLFVALTALFCHHAVAQQFSDSNLPIVVITTDGGVTIPDDPRVLATMKIIYRGEGQRNYLADRYNSLYLNYNGRISIEIRGSSSQGLAKKPYGFTTLLADNQTNNNVSLLGLPAENDWILNSLAFEPSCIRDYISYNLSRQIGEYASRTVYCEVVINGDYKGLYLLEEKIKADANRVDVKKITPDDIALPGLSGGYITKADKPNGDPVAWTMSSYTGGTVQYIHELPKPEAVLPVQTGYIRNQFDKLASTALTNNASITSGYPSIIDVRSFIDFMLVNELASNPDAYQFSTYFHKDRNGKLRAGPIWDLNLTYGNDLFIYGFDRSKPDIWQFENGDNDGSKFWRDLFYSPKFRCQMAKRWNELTQPGQPFDKAQLYSLIDNAVATISEALVREEARWGSIGDHAAEINGIKTFLDVRLSWITANIGSFTDCSQVALPPLVISKIMYNPLSGSASVKSSDLEFIRITNNGDQTVNLTGVFFSGTGLVYQFPANSTLNGHASLYLVGNAQAFKDRYWRVPFGEYTRSLSDSGQRIELSDAFGNIIDYVTYSDEAPWPDADGNGNYLDLADLSSDNTLPENWRVSSVLTSSDDEPVSFTGIKILPNPVHTMLRIESLYEIYRVTLYDISGNTLFTEEVGCMYHEVDMSDYRPGVYLLRIETANGVTTEKVIKN